ncbi:casein kinase I [Aphelenchoides avenae]|nr:casein kinase I [Aphelenchus avenae]
MKGQRLSSDRLPRNGRQSSNVDSVMQKELYNPLISSKDAGNSGGNESTRDQGGGRRGGRSHRGGHSRGKRRGAHLDASPKSELINAPTYWPCATSHRGQRGTAQRDSVRPQNSRGRGGCFNGNKQTGHAARHLQPGLSSGAFPPNNRGSVRGHMSAHHRPHRSRNAVEVVEALNDTDQKALLHSKVGMLVNKRFEVQQVLDRGSYGQVYVGFDHLLLCKVAVKFDEGKRNADRTSPSKRNELKDEYDIYTAIRNNYPSGKLEGIPEPFWYGEEFGFRILALELLGASLDALFTFSDYTLGLETVFEIGRQMIERICVVHESGYIHCDIKPENFLMGVGGEESVLYLIDFGLSRKYTYIDEDGTLKHIPQEKTSKGYVGTAKYASLNSLRCQALSRRDDLESAAYVLAEMIKGEAPFRKAHRWHGDDVQLDKRQRYLHSKEQVDWKRACPQMVAFIEYCKRLAFDEEPDYDYLTKCLRSATARNITSYPSLTIRTVECYACRRKKDMTGRKRELRPQRLNDSIASGGDARMAAAMRRSSAFSPATSRHQLSCKTDIDLADCEKLEPDGVMDLATYAVSRVREPPSLYCRSFQTQKAQRSDWKFSQDSVLDPRKCRRCEERLKSFYDAETQRTGELSWHVRRRINDNARTLYDRRFWWTTASFLDACEDQK